MIIDIGDDQKKWSDVSVMLRNPMPCWPNSTPFQCQRSSNINLGAVANSSSLTMGSHAGTHVDAPLHFVRDGNSIDTIPMDAIVGPARVIEIKDSESVKPEELRQYNIQRDERIIFKTNNSSDCWDSDNFLEDYVHISKEAAQFLVDQGVMTIGIDYLSVGGIKTDGIETHQILLGAGVWLIEGLNLSNIEAGEYYVVCLPLKISGFDSAPARVIVRPM